MRFFLLSVFFFLLIGGCAHNSKLKELKTAQFHFERASHYKEKGDNIKALENLTKIRQEFFYSPYNKRALLMTADIYFDQQKYQQSAQTYKKYQSLYSEKKDYVLYQLGLSYKNQLPRRAEHDLKFADPALRAFDQLLALREKSPYKKKALKALREILDKKAERELKTALFFKSQAWHQAGFKRIQYFIKHYPQSPLLPRALLTAFELAQKLNQNPEKFKERLLKEYPQSPSAQSLGDNSFLSVIKQKIL
ncbi:MAG: outer membrane protein assembly factor BamD [Oligoflexia bacterium]|nr:outer membrane protein assembly factor BamD [Oligoflexia bacterium]